MDFIDISQITTSRQSGDCLGARGYFLIWEKIRWIDGPFLCMCLWLPGEKPSKTAFFVVLGSKSIPFFPVFPIIFSLKSELIRGPIWGPEGPIWGSETRKTPFFMVLGQNPCFEGKHPGNDPKGLFLGSFSGWGLRGLFSACSFRVRGTGAVAPGLGFMGQNLSKTSQKHLKNNDFHGFWLFFGSVHSVHMGP